MTVSDTQREVLTSRREVPECNGTRAGARARSAWFRTAYSLQAKGLGRVERIGGDRFRFVPAISMLSIVETVETVKR